MKNYHFCALCRFAEKPADAEICGTCTRRIERAKVIIADPTFGKMSYQGRGLKHGEMDDLIALLNFEKIQKKHADETMQVKQ